MTRLNFQGNVHVFMPSALSLLVSLSSVQCRRCTFRFGDYPFYITEEIPEISLGTNVSLAR